MSLIGEITVGALAALETAFNEALRLDPESLRKLAALQGRVIAVELRGTGLTLYLFPGPDGVVLLGEYAGEPDTVLSGTPLGLARLSLGDASGVLFAGEVTIRGDVETGQRFKAILDQLDLDWEEPLARLIGDIPAHRLGKLVRGTTDWARQAFETLGRNTAEYLEYEARALATREDVAEFVADVDRLRDDLARLEARMARLRRARAEGRVASGEETEKS